LLEIKFILYYIYKRIICNFFLKIIYIVIIMNNKYECQKCGKPFRFESEYNKHINKKISCDIQEKKQYIILKRTCEYCGKTFARHNILTVHLSTVCGPDKMQQTQDVQNNNTESIKDIITKMQTHIINLETELKNTQNELKNTQNELKEIKPNTKIDVKGNLVQGNINNQNTVNNIQNNIKIIAYGKEDLSFISDENYRMILNKGFKSVPQLVEYIHFNENKPENQNIKINNMRDNVVLMFDGNNWQMGDRDEILGNMYDNKADILDEKFDELIDTLDEGTIKKFKRFLDQKDDNKINEKIKKELKLILYNKKQIKEVPRGFYNGDKKKDEKTVPIYTPIMIEPIKEDEEEITISTYKKRKSLVKT